MEEIVVLLSTYNGERYLVSQIDSILNQRDVNIKLIVRDDGSTDNTTDILENYSRNNKLHWYKGTNLGPANSFMTLLINAPHNNYYAFADQDDIWHPDKMKSAISFLLSCEQTDELYNRPLLYFCNKNIVDSDGNLIAFNNFNYQQSTVQPFLECFASGCCMVFNNHLRDLSISHLPSSGILHDHWIYIIASIFGKVLYDNDPHIDYRQHGHNVVGANYESIRVKIKYIFHQRKGLLSADAIAQDILVSFAGSLSNDDKDILCTIATYKKSICSKLKMLLLPQYTVPSMSILKKMYKKIKIIGNKI